MARRFALFVMYLLAFTLGAGSVAHAMEPIGCAGAGIEVSIGHDDIGQKQADGDKSSLHMHGGCHGHHLSTTPDAGSPLPYLATAGLLPPNRAARLVASISGPALRPPIA